MIFNNVKLMVYSNASKQIPGLTKLLMSITPKKVLEEGKAHMRLAVDQANKRLAMKTDRQDIMSYIIDSNYSKSGEGLSTEEIHANSYVLIIAGSETTATLLSGCLFLLMTHPEIYEKLVKEIRTSFKSESEITSAACANLKYLLAVLNEALRFYPPVPGALPRQVPHHGATVDGQPVPPGTAVSVYTWAANYSPSNFFAPKKFAPERWLGEQAPEEFKADVMEACQPFSFGPRNCAGKGLAYMEMRLVLARVLWNFDVDFAESEKGKNWLDQRVFLLWEKPPMMVKLTRRKV
jgi:cytochrome P450